jgi:hypothetical protein
VALSWLLIPAGARADELIVTAGGGDQPHADQHNRSVGVDYSFYRFERTARQHLQIGISYTRIHTDTDDDDRLWALTIYPQLSLYPAEDGAFRQLFPSWAAPYFFVRALGPSYLSTTTLGEREQANHFAFQAQVGFGLLLDLGRERTGILSLSWKHFSNADLFGQNDGIDVPLVVSLGMKI